MNNMQLTSGPGSEKENLQSFQANVGEGIPRVFRAQIGHIPENDVLYTDISAEDPQGGFETQSELKITFQSSDDYSRRMWELTAPQRNQLRARLLADANGNAQGELPTQESPLVSESVPAIERTENPLDAQPVYTPPEQPQHPDIPDPPSRGLSEDDVIQSVLITTQQSTIDDLLHYIQLDIDDKTRQALALRTVQRVEGLYHNYGLVNPFEPSTDDAE